MISNTLLRYGMIGIINTLVGYGIIVIFLYGGFAAESSNLMGYIVGFFLSYCLNKTYTFKSKNGHNSDLPRFLISMGLAYLLNLLTLIVFYRYFEMNVYVSQAIAGIVYTLVGYFLSKIWVFKRNADNGII